MLASELRDQLTGLIEKYGDCETETDTGLINAVKSVGPKGKWQEQRKFEIDIEQPVGLNGETMGADEYEEEIEDLKYELRTERARRIKAKAAL